MTIILNLKHDRSFFSIVFLALFCLMMFDPLFNFKITKRQTVRMMHPEDLQQVMDILKQNLMNKGAFGTSLRDVPILSAKTGISQRT